MPYPHQYCIHIRMGATCIHTIHHPFGHVIRVQTHLPEVFGADLGMDVEGFLSTCVYVNMKKAMEARFETCARSLPIIELQNLFFFITDSRYFQYAAIRIIGKPEWGQEKLPTAATCFNTLYLPLYENEALMTRKLCMATANCEGYGLV